MTVPAGVILRPRTHLYKVLAAVVIALIALQYLLSGVFDRRSIETIFTVNSSRYSGQVFRQTSVSGISGADNNATNASTTIAPLASSGGGDAPQSSIPNNFSKPEPIQVLVSDRANPNITLKAESIAGDDATPQSSSTTEQCPLIPPNLVGPLDVSKSPPDLMDMQKAFADVKQGGRGSPANCTSRYRVAIIIPFRDRFQHLLTLLYNLHPMLLRQQLDYQIFVVEQAGKNAFNRAMLMNIGYMEALKDRAFDCFIFHDVDLLPEDDRNLYTCPEQPRHMSVAVDKFKYKLPYKDLFGGVSALTTEQFRLVNGFSNVFWGWGGEDDDMANRIKAHGLHITRYPVNLARYKMLTHKKEKANPKRYEFLKTGKNRFVTDGLSSLQYEILDQKKSKLYTWFLVKLTQPS